MLDAKCVGDNFEMLVTNLTVFVTNSLYLFTLALGTNIQKTSPISQFCQQHLKHVINMKSPKSTCRKYLCSLRQLSWWQCKKSVTKMSNLSPTKAVSNIRYQHRFSRFWILDEKWKWEWPYVTWEFSKMSFRVDLSNFEHGLEEDINMLSQIFLLHFLYKYSSFFKFSNFQNFGFFEFFSSILTTSKFSFEISSVQSAMDKTRVNSEYFSYWIFDYFRMKILKIIIRLNSGNFLSISNFPEFKNPRIQP